MRSMVRVKARNKINKKFIRNKLKYNYTTSAG